VRLSTLKGSKAPALHIAELFVSELLRLCISHPCDVKNHQRRLQEILKYLV
jgi:hypothetical protein